jgi:hypothetical protein
MVGGACLPLFTISTITYNVVVYASADRADTLLLFLRFPYMYSASKQASIILGVNSSLIRVYPFLESRIPLSEPEGISS